MGPYPVVAGLVLQAFTYDRGLIYSSFTIQN